MPGHSVSPGDRLGEIGEIGEVGKPADTESKPQSAVAVMVETTADPVDWTPANASRVWGQVLTKLESMTETFARVVERVEPIGDNRLRLVFPGDAGLALQRCQLPEHQSALVESISREAGKPIRLEFAAAPKPARAKAEPTPVNRPSRQQRMREIEANPLIQSCVELFDAEIVRIEKPKPK